MIPALFPIPGRWFPRATIPKERAQNIPYLSAIPRTEDSSPCESSHYGEIREGHLSQIYSCHTSWCGNPSLVIYGDLTTISYGEE